MITRMIRITYTRSEFLAAFLLLITLACVLLGIQVLINAQETSRTASFLSVTGNISGQQVREASSRHYTDRLVYAPIVSYIVNGKTYSFTHGYYSNTPYVLGAPLAVKYNPLDPADAFLPTGRNYFGLAGLGSVFMLVLAIPCGIGYLARRNADQ